jgi:hypothetical protein
MSELPPPLPAWAERWVRFLDDGLRIPGTNLRFGLDAVVGFLFPAAGDALSVVSALSLFWLAYQQGLPRSVLLRMALNVGLDALIGAVPFLGDAFDLVWKANRKNLELIQRAAGQGPRHAPSVVDRLFLALILLGLLGLLLLPLVLSIWALHALFKPP